MNNHPPTRQTLAYEPIERATPSFGVETSSQGVDAQEAKEAPHSMITSQILFVLTSEHLKLTL